MHHDRIQSNYSLLTSINRFKFRRTVNARRAAVETVGIDHCGLDIAMT